VIAVSFKIAFIFCVLVKLEKEISVCPDDFGRLTSFPFL
jgi:hypothetical protein